MSDELARDPSSKVFVGLGDALLRLRQTDLARIITLRGLERHPHLAEAHDLLARISVDSGELERAFDEWDMVLRLSPGHLGALKGMGFVCFRREQFGEAERYLASAAAADPSDHEVSSALERVRALAPQGMNEASAHPQEADSRYLFVADLPDEGQTALLLDRSGLVLAGAYVAWDGRDVAQDVGAELSGVTDAARRATRHLALGDWTSIVFETDVAVVAMAPAAQDGLLVLATSRATPLGLVRRLLDRCATSARHWLEASV
ncbi:MAG: roadblock/LC7 domain-containing protein [Gemmatimonadota bacterium]|nr:roadblock/LC7 domain-containing protein [Gemmatimonadota bacterium]